MRDRSRFAARYDREPTMRMRVLLTVWRIAPATTFHRMPAISWGSMCKATRMGSRPWMFCMYSVSQNMAEMKLMKPGRVEIMSCRGGGGGLLCQY